MLKHLYRPKYYAAIHPLQDTYLLASIKKYRHEISFEGFCEGSLKDLAIFYLRHKIAICAPEEKILHQSWFFPKHLSSLDIYQQLAAQQKPNTFFDIELLNEANHLDEYLVIGNSITPQHMKLVTQPYEAVGFNVAAIETYSHVIKRQLRHPWQEIALARATSAQRESAEITLKLLDRENFYADELVALA